MCDKYRAVIAEKVKEVWKYIFNRRCINNQAIIDSSELCNKCRNRMTRINECRKGIENFAALNFNGTDLSDRSAEVRCSTAGLKVEYDKARGMQRRADLLNCALPIVLNHDVASLDD